MNILFDIGGTKMRVAAAGDNGILGEPRVMETPKNFDQAVSELAAAANDICQGQKIEAAFGGIRAYDKLNNTMRSHPNFPLWSGARIKDSLADSLTPNIYIENDSALAALGEALYGAGKGYRIVAYLTVSTGVGGAKVIDGEIEESNYGFEPGHQIIDNLHTLENLISGEAVGKKYGRPPKEIGDEHIWEELAKWLAIGLNNTIVHWTPDIVILGGSMMNEVGISIKKVKNYLKEMLNIYPNTPEIAHSSLDDMSGLYGAFALSLKNRK